MSKRKNSNGKSLQSEVILFFQQFEKVVGPHPLPSKREILFSSEWWQHPMVEAYCLTRRCGENGFDDLIDGFAAYQDKRAPKNLQVLTHFLEENAEITLETLKRNQLFRDPEVVNGLENWSRASTDSKATRLIAQFRQLCDMTSMGSRILKEVEDDLKKYSWFEFLALLAIWWEKLYAKRTIEQGYFPHLPPDMASIASEAIRCKMRGGDKPPTFSDPIPLQEQFMVILRKCKDPRYWQPFETTIEKLFSHFLSQQLSDMVAYQGHRLFQLGNGQFIAVPQSAEHERNWERIEEQINQLQAYFQRVGINELGPEKVGHPLVSVPLDPGHQIRWHQLGFPDKIKFGKQEVDMARGVLFFTALGEFHKGRYLEKFQETYPEAVEAKDPFPARKAIEDAIFGTNLWFKPMMGPLNIASSDYIVERVMGKIYFHQDMDSAQLKAVVDFLALEMAQTSPNFQFDLFEFPFLKFGDVIFYLTSIIPALDPSMVFQNRLFAEAAHRRKKGDGTLIQVVSDHFEEKIDFIFKRAGFQTRRGLKLWENGRVVAEIDVLAWRNNELLVIEAKNTYYRRELKNIWEHWNTLELAGRQVDRSIEHIEQHLSAFLERIGADSSNKDWKMFGLVVSATQEGNYEHYGRRKSPKISLSELAILLSNAKGELLDWNFEALVLDLGSRKLAKERFKQMQMSPFEGNPVATIGAAQLRNRAAMEQKALNECSTWGFQHTPSVSKLMERIEEDWLWKDIIEQELSECPSSNASDSEVEAYLQFEKGLKHFNNEEFNLAVPCFDAAWKLNPTKVAYLRLLADATADRGLPMEAIELYTKMIELFPDCMEGYLNRGATYAQVLEQEKALEDYRKAAQIDPKNIDALFSVYCLEYSLGFETITETDMRRILRINMWDPRIAWPHLMKYERIKQELKAKSMKSIDEMMNLSEAYFYKFEYLEALRWINKILDLEPNHVKALYNRGWFKVIQKKYEPAIHDFQRVLEIDPLHANAWDQVGSCLLHLDRTQEAKVAYQHAIELQPDLLRAWYNFGHYWKDIGNIDAARECFEKAIEDVENGTNALRLIGQIHEAKGDLEKAMNAYEQAVMKGNDEAYMSWHHAYCMLQAKKSK